jgi:hypothetical protein
MPSTHCSGSQSVTDPCSHHSVSRYASRHRLRRRQPLTRSSTFTFGVAENRGSATRCRACHNTVWQRTNPAGLGSLCCDSATWRGIQIVLPSNGHGRDLRQKGLSMAGLLRVPRSRGALSGVVLVLLGAWGALIPFIGPYFQFAYTPGTPRHQTRRRRGWRC